MVLEVHVPGGYVFLPILTQAGLTLTEPLPLNSIT